jgi:hypothetical protein
MLSKLVFVGMTGLVAHQYIDGTLAKKCYNKNIRPFMVKTMNHHLPTELRQPVVEYKYRFYISMLDITVFGSIAYFIVKFLVQYYNKD